MELAQKLTKTPGHETTSEWATFAAGCFWSVELVYQRVEGVLQTQVGYTGGLSSFPNPTYKQVCAGNTNHAEAVLLEYNPQVVTYSKLLDVFFDKHDPTQVDGQGGDRGTQYRSAIFYHNDDQRKQALAAVEAEQHKYTGKIVTQIVQAPEFFPAEEYHQKYLEKGGQCALKGSKEAIRCYG